MKTYLAVAINFNYLQFSMLENGSGTGGSSKDPEVKMPNSRIDLVTAMKNEPENCIDWFEIILDQCLIEF